MKIIKKHLDVSEYTRSQIPLERLTGLVIHYTDSATDSISRDINWLYAFLNENRPARHKYASYHYAIDQDGSVYELIPPNECAWHAGPTSKTDPKIREQLEGAPNWSTLGISFLHPDPSGKPTEASRKALIQLCGDLLFEHDISENNIIRHYDCTGKNCPKYFVEDESEWIILKQNIRARLYRNRRENR